MRKITFLALHLGFGGVEKAVVNQANILCENYEVQIISAYKLYDEPVFKIDERVRVSYLLDIKPNRTELKEAVKRRDPVDIIRQGGLSLRVLIMRTKAMKSALKTLKSDFVVSTRLLYNSLLVKNRPRGAVIMAQEHRHHNNDEKYIRKLTASVRGMDYFLPVSRELTEFYSERLRGSGVKCVYIPHNLDYWPEEPADKKGMELVSVGRLSPEKGFPDLIDVFALIRKEMPTAVLNIIGDGDELSEVKRRIEEHGLQNSVILHGYRDKQYVNEILKRSSLYVMASFEESFGIVLIEAQSFGLPCIAFDGARGAAEIITDRENGYLIANRDKSAFAEKAVSLMRDYDERVRLGNAARKNAEQYTAENVSRLWNEFYENAALPKEE